MSFTPAQIERDHKVWSYVGSLQTVCKGIQNADAVCINEKSELALEREFRNKVDPCAIKVVVKCAQYDAEDDTDTSDENYSSSSDESPSPSAPLASLEKKQEQKKITRWKYCGYLPAKLVPFLAPIMDQYVLKKNVCVAIDCILRGREKDGLSSTNKRLTWFDIQLDFWINESKDDDKDAVNAVCELILKAESNPEILT